MDFIKKHILFIAVLFLVVFNFLLWNRVLTHVPSNNLKVYFLDVGQGDATFIEAPNGNQILIDGGGVDNKVLRELGEVMPPTDRSIDMVVATHPDADHIGGLVEVLRRYRVATFLESGNRNKDTRIFETLLNLIEEIEKDGMIVEIARSGKRYVIDEERGIYLDILFPDRDMVNTESNSSSIIGKLIFGEVCFLLTGDAPKSVEEYLVKSGVNIECDVLKAGHHGSRTSSSASFVKKVNPGYVIISSGLNNRYGHPHKEVIDIFNSIKSEILRTDLMGRIEFETNSLEIFY